MLPFRASGSRHSSIDAAEVQAGSEAGTPAATPTAACQHNNTNFESNYHHVPLHASAAAVHSDMSAAAKFQYLSLHICLYVLGQTLRYDVSYPAIKQHGSQRCMA